MPILAAGAGAAVEPLVVILEGDGAWLPVGVALDGIDLIVGPRTQVLVAAIDAPLAAAGLVATLGGASLGCIARTAPQEQGQLVAQGATVPAKTQCLAVTLVHAQGGGSVGAWPACAQALHGTQVEQPVSGDPLPALGRKAGIAGWRDSDLPTLGLH